MRMTGATNTETALIPTDTNDDTCIRLWLHNRSPHTQRACARGLDRFRQFVGKPLAAVTLSDMQAFADSLADLAPASQARTLASVKSLFSFAHRLGYLTFDVARAVRLPQQRDALAAHILPEEAVVRMIALEPNQRNRVLLKVLYASGARVSEVCCLTWRDSVPREAGGQITLLGKGGKVRHVLPARVWDDLMTLRGDAGDDAPVFRSRSGGGPLSPVRVERIVRAAAVRGGIAADVTPHWLRHSHVSHALDRGAPVHLVQQTVGHASLATTTRYSHARPSESSGLYLVI
jgi:integrase/recombinase XerD